ncbi:MAG: FAD-dependent oxidoreductase [Saccharofermentans sp.]|nr:FAD-dependent oxidoreductase [Saccharofermentans sp.]
MDSDIELLDKKKTVCIIGSGLSGLVCGMRLVKAGFNVTIVEELVSPGGLLAYTRIGREYLELLPHHLRKSDKALLALSKEMGVDDKINWFDSAWSGKASHRKVGYYDGGFACLISSLMQAITDNGGQIYFSTTVAEISRLASGMYRTSCILSNSTRVVFDSTYVIFTGSCRTFINVSHGLPIPMDDRDILMNITYSTKISAMMVLKHELSQMFYQVPPKDSGLPFNAIINHTGAFGERGYGGSVVYLVGTCSITDPLWIGSDAEIMLKYFTGLRKLYPSLRKTDIKSWRLTKTRYATTSQYPEIDLSNPCENLYVCSTGLTKFATADIPENRMDSVVSLAGRISSDIIRSYEESLNRTAEHAPITELNAQDKNIIDTLGGAFS